MSLLQYKRLLNVAFDPTVATLVPILAGFFREHQTFYNNHLRGTIVFISLRDTTNS